MTADRNKTELTQNITRNVALWLGEMGFKPVETEVAVAPEWVADVAGVCCPTRSEMIALKLTKRPPTCPPCASPERRERYHAAYHAWSNACGDLPPVLTALVEVKASVGDYRGDRKWTADPWPADLCYVAMPDGLIAPEEWPLNWGVILFSRDGATVLRTRAPVRHDIAIDQRLAFTVALAVSRDNKTRFAREREWQKEVRIQEGDRRTVARVSDALRAVIDIANGVPVAEALQRRGIRPQLPDDVLRELERLRLAFVAPHSRGTGEEAARVIQPTKLRPGTSTLLASFRPRPKSTRIRYEIRFDVADGARGLFRKPGRYVIIRSDAESFELSDGLKFSRRTS